MNAAEQAETTPQGGPTLGELVAGTDTGLVLVHDACGGRVGSVVLREPGSVQRIPPAAVVLAVGFERGSRRFEQLMLEATEANATAVVAKPATIDHEAFRALGSRHKLSTALTDQSTDWLSLASMLRSASALAVVDPVAGARVGDLFGFANAVALAAGGATAIVDPTGTLLGFSNLPEQPLDELRRNTTVLMAEQDSPAQDPDYRRVYANTGCVHVVGDPGTFDRAVIAVRSDKEILGSIWVLVPERQQWATAENALLELVEPAVIHLHHARAELDVEQSRHAVLLRSVLRGESTSLDSITALGIEDHNWFRLAMPVSVGSAAISRRHMQLVTSWLRMAHPTALFTEIDSHLVVLFSGTRERAWHAIATSLDEFACSAVVQGSLTVTTSFAASHPRDLSNEFHRLSTLAGIIARSTGPASASSTTRMEDHWAEVELTTLARLYNGRDANRLGFLAAIRDYDRQQHTDYWRTLRAYVLCDRNYSEAATSLNLHQNTVRYRIEKLRTIFDLDINKPATFAWIIIQMHRHGSD